MTHVVVVRARREKSAASPSTKGRSREHGVERRLGSRDAVDQRLPYVDAQASVQASCGVEHLHQGSPAVRWP